MSVNVALKPGITTIRSKDITYDQWKDLLDQWQSAATAKKILFCRSNTYGGAMQWVADSFITDNWAAITQFDLAVMIVFFIQSQGDEDEENEKAVEFANDIMRSNNVDGNLKLYIIIVDKDELVPESENGIQLEPDTFPNMEFTIE